MTNNRPIDAQPPADFQSMMTPNLRKGLGLLISVIAAVLLVLNSVDLWLAVMIGMVGIFIGADQRISNKTKT